MKKVRCCYINPYPGLTRGKVYDVVRINHNEYYDHSGNLTQPGVVIIADDDRELSFKFQTLSGDIVFENVTTECRNETINGILT